MYIVIYTNCYPGDVHVCSFDTKSEAQTYFNEERENILKYVEDHQILDDDADLFVVDGGTYERLELTQPANFKNKKA